MRILFVTIIIQLLAATSWAGDYNPYGSTRKNNPEYSQDSHGSYTKNQNMWKDQDRDGVSNYYDRNDRNPNITNQPNSNYNNSYNGNSYGGNNNSNGKRRNNGGW